MRAGVSPARRRRLNLAERRQAKRVDLKAEAAVTERYQPAGDLTSIIARLQATLENVAASIARSSRLQTTNAPTEADEAPTMAFAAGPRARALLRGKQIAATDLAESGGGYTLEDVRLLLNSVSRQSIEKRVREGRLLAVAGPNNKRVYPVAQFHDDGSVVEGLSEVQDALATRNGYAVLNFLVNPDPRLGDRKPIDLLKQGEVAAVVAAAARVGEQGA